MFNKFEMIGAGASVFFMALALYMVQVKVIVTGGPQSATIAAANEPGLVVVGESENVNQARAEAYLEAMDDQGNVNRMVIDDIKVGVGEEVKEGDLVSVHYIGTLQNGVEFDNSRKHGQAFDFVVGDGQVIQGWDKGLLGMKVGGQRVLVIPPEMAYGEQGIGPIPGNATLIFAIELLEIK